jgi:hypothetical protein
VTIDANPESAYSSEVGKPGENAMDPKNYSRLAAVIFAVIVALQLVRVVLAWDVTLNGVPIPLFVSAIAAFVAAIMAWLGFGASR